jgi:pyrimidine operon attenuation protein/uracil phosphoribosyltransferase
MSDTNTLIQNHHQIQQKINRIAYQIYENNYLENEIVMAGIADRGYILAQKIIEALSKVSNLQVTLLELKIDKENPFLTSDMSIENIDFSNKVILVVDDVLNSGKTLMYGVKLFLKNPVKKISTIVLVDRNHKTYPINADYVGLSLATTFKQNVSVVFEPNNDAVFLK